MLEQQYFYKTQTIILPFFLQCQHATLALYVSIKSLIYIGWINIPHSHIVSTKRLVILPASLPQASVVRGTRISEENGCWYLCHLQEKKIVSRFRWMYRTCTWQRHVRHKVRKTGHLQVRLSSVSNKKPAVFSVFQA